jgi:hypothetical protein
VVIDRVPCPSTSSFGLGSRGGVSGPPEPTVVTYGSPMGRCGYHVAPLGADGPHYAVHSGGPDDDDKGGPSVAAKEGRGTDAKKAPRAPPARNLLDLLPKSLVTNPHGCETVTFGAESEAMDVATPSDAVVGVDAPREGLGEDGDGDVTSIVSERADWYDPEEFATMEKRGTAARGTAGSDEARRGWGGTPMPAEGTRSVAAPSTTRITPTYTLMATGSLFPTSSICEKKVPTRLQAPTIASAPPPPHNNHPKRKRVKRKCSQQNCENNVVQGSVCLTHGA